MLCQLVIAFIVLTAVSAATHLRGEIQSEEVPLNPGLFERYAVHILPKLNGTLSGTTNIQKGKNLKFSAEKATLSNGNYFVTRKYKNGNCAGTATEETGVRLNACIYSQGQAYSHSCTAGDESTVPHTKKITSGLSTPLSYDYTAPADCSFEASAGSLSVTLNNDGNKCEIDAANLAVHGYQMQAATCGDFAPAIQGFGPGLLTLYTATDTCDQLPDAFIAYRHQPFGLCQLYVDHSSNTGTSRYTAMNTNTDFFYMQMKSCNTDGKVEVHAFADPHCRRKLFRGEMNMWEHPMFHQCNYDSAMDMMGALFCAGTDFSNRT